MQSISLRSSHEAARLARDLKKDLGCLRKRGIDPATFLGGVLMRIAARAEKIISC